MHFRHMTFFFLKCVSVFEDKGGDNLCLAVNTKSLHKILKMQSIPQNLIDVSFLRSFDNSVRRNSVC